MQIWTSSEAVLDVDEALSAARKDVERELNKAVTSADYGDGVSKWALIYIVMPENDPRYSEVHRYTKRTKVVEFRLKVDHRAFKEGDALAQRKLLAAAIMRSLELSKGRSIPAFALERFKNDVAQALQSHNWM